MLSVTEKDEESQTFIQTTSLIYKNGVSKMFYFLPKANLPERLTNATH